MMPVIFIGHGSPMNAIEDNEFTDGWKKIAADIPKPKAILCVSAHWETEGTKVSILKTPKTIHDFYGFPKALFDVEYNAEGSLLFAEKTLELLGKVAAGDASWGFDHGAWSVLRVMYPKADIPVYQVSIDHRATAKEIFGIGQKLAPLRKEGVLIIGSGNIVHNLKIFDFSIECGFEWAENFDDFIGEKINERDFESILRVRDYIDGRDQTGANQTGANQTGANQTGANQTGANQTGANQTGANQTGANQTGANQTGANQTGANQTGENQTGENQTGENQPEETGMGEAARLAIPTTEHFDPLIYVLGAAKQSDNVRIYNKACVAGSISMTSYVFG